MSRSAQLSKVKISEIHMYTDRVYDAVARLLPQLSPDSELPSKKHLKEILKSGTIRIFIAELDKGQIIGMLTIATYDLLSGTKVWIEDVVVDESHRGKGIGEELTLFAVSYARSTGAGSIELTSRPSRIAANQLYQKLGFVLRETNVYRYLLK